MLEISSLYPLSHLQISINEGRIKDLARGLHIDRGGNFLLQTFVVVYAGIYYGRFQWQARLYEFSQTPSIFQSWDKKKEVSANNHSFSATTLLPSPPFLLDVGVSLIQLQNLEWGASASPSISLCINYSLLIHHYTLIIPCVQCRFDCTMKIATRPTIALHSLLSSLLTGRRCDTFY